ncbi:MAG: hypothetical protein ACI8SE_000098 [Bacteroidia bacterium]|jgi:hypothetical protein
MKKILHKLLIATLLVCGFVQVTSGQTSPYTLGSLGFMQSAGFTQHSLMGGLSGSLRDKGDFSLVNPASLSALTETSLQTGSFIDIIEQKSATKRNTDNHGDFGHFALGLPISIKKNIGFAAGLNRMTSMDYTIPNTTTENGEDVLNIFAGKGSVNRFQTALGIQVAKGLSLGAEASFIFGNTEEIVDKQFIDNRSIFSTRNTKTNYYSGVRYTGGVQYTGQIFKSKQFVLGLFATPKTSITMSRDELVQTYNYQGNFYIDTISNRKDAQFSQDLPLEIGASLSFGNEDVWNLGVEYSAAKWSDITPRSSDNAYFDQESITIGGYWQREKAELKSRNASSTQRVQGYLNMSRLYYGFNMQNLYTGVVNQQVQQMTFSLGIGLPLMKPYSLEGTKYVMVSRINIGLEYTIRGNTDPGMIQENIFGIKFGLTLSDKWFIKRKYQ